LVGNVSRFYREEFELVKRDDGTWLVDIIRYMIFDYFDLDELINDYEVTTVGGLVMTELSHIPAR
jgi:putative hemolysin